MASKQLGKLKQWAGEVISSRDKAVVTDEFRELEQDIELRRQGLWRLHVVSEEYREYLCKKKHSEALEGSDKMMPVDALGVVMIQHGEEFGEDSAYGVSLMNFGRAHCKIAALQETFAMTLEDTYVASLRRAEDEIKEYHAQRKKLESRRLSYDAVLTKVEKIKSSKKTKDQEKAEAEDEYETAKARYEQTAEDVRARMYAIQENEVAQLRELTQLLDIEMKFVTQYLDVLHETKAAWIDESTLTRMEPSRPTGATHNFARAAAGSRAGSVRSHKSLSKTRHSESSEDETTDDEATRNDASLARRRSEAGSKAPSRSQSRASRKRSDSTATAASEKDKAEKSRRMSVAGWASSAVNSLTGHGKKDRDKFASLRDREESSDGEGDAADFGAEIKRPTSALSSSSKKSKNQKGKSTTSSPVASPQLPSRVPKSSQGTPTRKVAVALHDFNAASPDELSFKVGDRITVLNEVTDGWWLGECTGKRGLFPTTYTEIISSTSSLPLKPPLPQRPPAISRVMAMSAPSSLGNASSRQTLVNSDISDAEDHHPFGDHYMAQPSPTLGQFGAIEPASSDDEQHLMPRRRSPGTDDEQAPKEPTARPIPSRRPTDPNSTPTKKAPPPPPPRRPTLSLTPGSTPPPIPSRPPTGLGRSSQSSSATSLPPSGATGMGHSPFDSPRDSLQETECHDFKQYAAMPQGMCRNCFQIHQV
ncbi:BAR-domain-containing protein [Obba rivulosa]|uniref:BAR-domain-containing protein n=1 Tax=Obba rivulosa TaxID=1052685 RepID=A0A8E2AXU9_9APHY|nr:BAR-domain-containing protein [Obba rivulosa]